MTTFKEIQGRNIRSYTTNPDNPLEGQMWYNSTSQVLKGVVASGAWSSAAPQIYTNFGGGRAGTQTAALGAGGYAGNAPSGPTSSTTEYDGSSWSLHPASLTTGRGALNGCGTQTAAAVFGGQGPYPGPGNATEEFNGSSWTNGGDLNAGRRNYFGAGTQTAALCAGGFDAGAAMNESEEYNGSIWAAGNTLGTAVYYNVGTGTQTAALSIGGYTPPVYPNSQNETEEYDGTSWTAGGTMGTRRAYAGAFGSQTDAIVAGGSGPPSSVTANVEQYNGTSWTEINNISVAKNLTGQAAGGTSNSNAGVVWNGYGPADTPSANSGNNLSEEWNFTANTITPGAWASGGSLGTARAYVHGCGLQTAALAVSGFNGTIQNLTEEYDGTSWTEQSDMGTSRYNVAALGIQTAAIAAGGRTPPPDSGSTTVESYNGSSWTSAPSLTNARTYLSGVGTVIAGLVAMGAQPRNTASNHVEEYNGVAWSEQTNMSTARWRGAASGIQTSAVYFGGTEPSASNKTEEYDGSSWTAGGNLGATSYFQGSSTNTPGSGSALNFGGHSTVTATEGYDGTAWSTRPSLGTGREALGGAGTSSAALAYGGRNPGYIANTEEFTGETVSANIKTFTTS